MFCSHRNSVTSMRCSLHGGRGWGGLREFVEVLVHWEQLGWKWHTMKLHLCLQCKYFTVMNMVSTCRFPPANAVPSVCVCVCGCVSNTVLSIAGADDDDALSQWVATCAFMNWGLNVVKCHYATWSNCKMCCKYLYSNIRKHKNTH